MQKRTRLAACEPCRLRKQSCDHVRPVCTRCTRRGREGDCDYRDRPFQKHQRVSNVQSAEVDETPSRARTNDLSNSSRHDHQYPDPGYLGHSSYDAVFNRVSEHRNMDEIVVNSFRTQQGSAPHGLDNAKFSEGTNLISSIVSQIDVASCKGLMSFWLGKGNNLVLGGILTKTCVESMIYELASLTNDLSSHSSLARRLFDNSTRRHSFSSTATLEDFCEEFGQNNIRWETFAISLVALGRATIDVQYHPPLYSTQAELDGLQKLLTEFSDVCLELALSLGYMDDLLLICQYENWILHSVIYGDQSFDSWRRLGDVISSVLYLGYHQPSKLEPNTPYFLEEMRKTSFARIYSDDKNVAVFFGRPPRLSSAFCCFQLPRRPLSCDENPVEISGDQHASSSNEQDPALFGLHEVITFSTSIRWAALCARLKEKALEIIHAADPEEMKKQRAATVKMELTQLWSGLPLHLKIEGSLQSNKHRGSFEQDFLLFARLEYLQVEFLLASRELLQRNTGVSQDDKTLLEVSGEMLSLVMEAIVCRHHLVNSGTGLVWKVAHYGLPAAGVISLSLLQPPLGTAGEGLLVHRMVQHLAVFVAEVRGEGFIRAGDPDYALMHRAAHSIDRVLEKLLLGTLQKQVAGNTTSAAARVPVSQTLDEHPWNLATTGDSLGYELDFWRMLGEHPSLLDPGDLAMEAEWLGSSGLSGADV